MSAYTVVPVEMTGLVKVLQALPVSGSSDSVNVQIRKLAQTEVGRETVRRFANRAALLLLAGPTKRICPGDPVAAQCRAQAAQTWQASFEAGVDVQTELWRELLAHLPEGSNAARYDEATELTCRLIQDVR
ncbi:hypothetical protein GCM10022631_01470 [Deinococcus rubellus]|uniref:Uncharacterized protein n=1 Tax=Deinococcus rubellus TaxID=1889240 RepID=A0ABY5YI11_9DEIO|nr:hypothetical protein [Deinococcus rubellus]UWX64727.1 hypothetical protein N0D28_03450 [Deinococcus rubellus]